MPRRATRAVENQLARFGFARIAGVDEVSRGCLAGPVLAANDCPFMSFSGLDVIEKAIDGLRDYRPSGGLFLVLLACEGGCVNGPRSARRNGTVEKRCRVLNYGNQPEIQIPRTPSVDIHSVFIVKPAPEVRYPDAQVREALRMVGKYTREDELNCGGCDYDSCREFAAALINQKAERSLCVTYMRKLAHKKANALIQKMPSAVVIVNDAMRVIEFNQAFASMFA